MIFLCALWQSHSEHQERGKFEETLGALKIFTLIKYIAHIYYLNPVFVNLTQPVLNKQTLRGKKETIKLKDDLTKNYIYINNRGDRKVSHKVERVLKGQEDREDY